jgi:hypothetical protein
MTLLDLVQGNNTAVKNLKSQVFRKLSSLQNGLTLAHLHNPFP